MKSLLLIKGDMFTAHVENFINNTVLSSSSTTISIEKHGFCFEADCQKSASKKTEFSFVFDFCLYVIEISPARIFEAFSTNKSEEARLACGSVKR